MKGVSDFEVHGDDLLVFVDDTGHEEFADTQFPVFGFGGCLAMGHAYRQTIQLPWLDLIRHHLSDLPRPLHAAKIRLAGAQMEAVGRFFSQGLFFRFAVTTYRGLEIPEPLENTYDTMAGILVAAVSELCVKHNPARLILVVEASQRGDRLAQKHFGSLRINAIDSQKIARPLPVIVCLLPKTSCEPGLEIADFVAHTAGRHTKQVEGGHRKQEVRRDFKSIFQDCAEELVEFRMVTLVEMEKVPTKDRNLAGKAFFAVGKEPVDK